MSNISINLKSEESTFSTLVNLTKDILILLIEFRPEDVIFEDKFRVYIEKAFSNPKLWDESISFFREIVIYLRNW